MDVVKHSDKYECIHVKMHGDKYAGIQIDRNTDICVQAGRQLDIPDRYASRQTQTDQVRETDRTQTNKQANIQTGRLS